MRKNRKLFNGISCSVGLLADSVQRSCSAGLPEAATTSRRIRGIFARYGHFMRFGILLTTAFGWALPAQTEEQTYTLRLHHYMPGDSVEHTKWLLPWARQIEVDSQGRLKIEVYPNMQLGGRAFELYDQAR